MEYNNNDGRPSSYIEWGPVFAGAVLASAITIVLLQFGSAVGLAAASPFRGEGTAARGGIVAAGLWLMWAQITASIGGGYSAGRLRAPLLGDATLHEREVRDGAHGLISWATATVAVFLVVSAGAALSALAPAAIDKTTDVSDAMIAMKKNAAVIFAFVIGASSLISGVAAWWAGYMGGEHRDGRTDFSKHVSFRKKA